MSRVFVILGAIFGAIILTIVIAAAIFIPGAIKRDHEAVSYIQDAVPKIVANWNSQELVDRATPELLASAKKNDELDRLFVMFKQLGALKRLDTPVGSVVTSAFTGTGVATVGNYKAHAEFANGEASIEIQLLRAGTTWKINGFRIDSDALLPPNK